MVDMELDDPEIGDPEIGDPEMGDVEMSDVEMVYPVIDPPVLDIGPIVMDMDPVDEHYRKNMGVEDFGRLISHKVSSSKFCSSKYMTPAGNQKPLDSCVSHTLSAALGALAALTFEVQNAPEFSTQEMVDCLPIKKGGVSYEAGYEYVLKNGLHMKDIYPDLYIYGSPCRCPQLRGQPKYSFGGYFLVPEDEVIDKLSSHPLTAGIHLYESFVRHTAQYVSTDDLMGVYSPSEGEQPIHHDGKIVDHAILVVGYGVFNNEPFYIIKSSWGVEWGVNGYARVAARLLFCFAFPSSFRFIPTPR